MKFRAPDRIVPIIQDWMLKKVTDAHKDGVVVGLSGGIDSSVVAALGSRVFNESNGKRVLGLYLPCYSNRQDGEDAYLLAKTFSIPIKTVRLEDSYDFICRNLREIDGYSKTADMARANLKARLRMSTLYAVAQLENLLVCGTSNKTEYEIGYFTKWGDSASDLWPIADLYKTEVRSIADYLKIPEEIIKKAPSAGLWEGKTDEDEIGTTYEDLDHYLLESGDDLNEEIRNRIESLRIGSEHKRIPVPICKIDLA